MGYEVYCTERDTYGVMGFSITLHTQAQKYSTAEIDERIEKFLAAMRNRFNKLTTKKLNEHVNSLIQLKELGDLHIEDEVDRFWDEIIYDDYLFDRNDMEIDACNEITLPELKKWFNTYSLHGSKFRKLSVQVSS